MRESNISAKARQEQSPKAELAVGRGKGLYLDGPHPHVEILVYDDKMVGGNSCPVFSLRHPPTHTWVGETRPYLQGARLTAWELQVEQIPCTLVTDSAAATLMAAGRVDAVLVGCDRVAANGDTANKIGTLSLAVLARHYDVPFYVCMPTSTLDHRCADGASIPIEERGADEVRGHKGVQWAADVPVYNPAFDVTPAHLVTGWITEHGVWRPPFPHPGT